MRSAVKVLAAVSFLAAVCAPASAAGLEDLAPGQAAALNSLSSRNIPDAAVPKPVYSLTRDVFLEVDACSILNAQFIMQPMMKDALNMLKPCLAGVSELTGNAPISADSVKGGKAIEIVVLGGKNQNVQELISGALAKRNNRIFGYPAAAVLHAAEPHLRSSADASRLTRDVFLEADACSILNAQFIMQPMMKDALNMLKPCLAGVSELTGNAPISADSVKGGKAIEIVVLGGKNQNVQELISGALAKRNNRIFGYPAAAVLHAAEPH